MMSRGLVGMALLLGACAVRAEPDPGATRVGSVASAIVNGSASSASQDATVLLSIGADGTCTGTLITPNLVLTARHCVQEVDGSTECGAFTTSIVPSTITVSLGASADGTTIAARGKKAIVDSGTTICSHDIALLVLDKDVAGAKIAQVRFGKVAVGELTKAVGYGEDGSGQLASTRLQRASLPITGVGPSPITYKTQANQAINFNLRAGEIATGESTCFGDSGGPLFDAKDQVIGLTSRGLDQNCIDHPSIFTDVASHETMIRNAASGAGHPLSAAPATGDGQAEGDGGDPAEEDESDTTSASEAKRPARGDALTPQANAGCAIARRGSSSTPRNLPGAPILALIVAGALLLRRAARLCPARRVGRRDGLRRQP